MRQKIGNRPDMAADLDDVGTIANKMRRKHLTYGRSRSRQMRQGIGSAGWDGSG